MAEGPGFRYTVELRPRSLSNTVHHAIETADFKKLEQYLKDGLDRGHAESVTLQEREEVLGLMPIHVASEFGKLEVVEFLILKRVDLEAGDRFRVTALHLACIENHIGIVQALLKARCNVNQADDEGDLPIHWAATKGNSEVIKLLLQNGAKLDTANKSGWTPLHRAAYNGRKDAVDCLVKAGAKMGGQNKDGNTPLHLAVLSNQLASIEVLCQAGAKQDIVNNSHQAPGDLCLNDAERELLTLYNWNSLLLGKDIEKKEMAPSEEGTAGDHDRMSRRTPPERNTPRRVPRNQDGFPDLPSAAKETPSRAGANCGSENWSSSEAFMRSGTASGLEMHTGRAASPYAMSQAASGAGSSSQRQPERRSGIERWVDAQQPSSTWHSNGSSSFKLGRQGPPLPPITPRGEASTSQSSAITQRNSISTDDYQGQVRAENRRAAASVAAANGKSLSNRGGLKPASDKAPPRPVSGNKKFLSKYNLGHMNLFAPAGN